MRFNFLRDATSTAVGIFTGGIAGTLIKKFFIRPDSSIGGKLVGGAFSLLFGGPGGVLSFLLAEPGREAKAAYQSTRQSVAQSRYSWSA